jgi:hypothetical protein
MAEKGPDSEATLEVVQCARTLPANAKMALVWGRGIATPSGQTNPADQRLEFQVRDHFSAHLRCQRENAKAGCMPLLPLRVEFTAPVPRACWTRSASRTPRARPIANASRNRPSPPTPA